MGEWHLKDIEEMVYVILLASHEILSRELDDMNVVAPYEHAHLSPYWRTVPTPESLEKILVKRNQFQYKEEIHVACTSLSFSLNHSFDDYKEETMDTPSKPYKII